MSLLQALCAPLFLLLASSTCKASTLEDTCKFFAAGHPDIGYAYCMKTFQADKRSANADKHGLAIIAVRITGDSAGSTSVRIAKLHSSEKDSARRQRLGVCAEVYSDAATELDEAGSDIARGKPNDVKDAVTQLSAVLDAPTTCEDTFSEAHDRSPLTSEDAEFRKQATIALAVTASLGSSAWIFA